MEGELLTAEKWDEMMAQAKATIQWKNEHPAAKEDAAAISEAIFCKLEEGCQSDYQLRIWDVEESIFEDERGWEGIPFSKEVEIIRKYLLTFWQNWGERYRQYNRCDINFILNNLLLMLKDTTTEDGSKKE